MNIKSYAQQYFRKKGSQNQPIRMNDGSTLNQKKANLKRFFTTKALPVEKLDLSGPILEEKQGVLLPS